MGFFHVNYFSPVLGFGTDIEVFVPTPNSDEILNHKDSGYFHDGVRFPVLYVLHGAFGDCTDWARLTGIERYAQERKAVLVMASADNSFYQDMYRGGSYFTYISDEVPEYIERFFPVSKLREETFIAGLSMGGYGALHVALARPEKYSAAISLSGAVDIAGEIRRGATYSPFCWEDIFRDPEHVEGTDADIFYQLKKLLGQKRCIPRLFQSCGTEDFLYDMNRSAYRRICDMGVQITFDEAPGRHDWNYWDAGIVRALDWLFEPAGSGQAGK